MCCCLSWRFGVELPFACCLMKIRYLFVCGCLLLFDLSEFCRKLNSNSPHSKLQAQNSNNLWQNRVTFKAQKFVVLKLRFAVFGSLFCVRNDLQFARALLKSKSRKSKLNFVERRLQKVCCVEFALRMLVCLRLWRALELRL